MSILNTLLLLSILTFAPLTHALEEALGTPTTVSSSPLAVPIAQVDPATLLEAALQLREAKPALFAGAQGVLIVNVVPGSQAAEKRLQPGDIVIAYAGEAMDSVEQLVKAMQAKANGAQVVLRVIRGEKVEEVGLRGGKMGIEFRNVRSPRAPEFAKQLKVAVQAGDYEKMVQLIRDNPKLAKEILPPELLTALEQVLPELELILKEGLQAYAYFDYRLAIETWKLGLEHSQQLKNKHYISQFLGNLGMVYDDLGQYSKALEYCEKSLAIAKEIGDRRGEGSDLTNLGVVHQNLGQYSKALEYYKKALVIHQEIGSRRGEGSDLTNLGNVYYDLGQYPKALEKYNEALKIYREIGDRRGEGDNLTNLGVMYDELGQHHKALEYYENALVIHQEIGDRRGERADLINLSMVYKNLGQYPKVLEYYGKSLVIEIDDRRGEGSDLTNLGVVYQDLGQYPKALEYYEKALAIRRELGDKRGEGSDLNNLGVLYQNLGQYDQAKTHFQDSISIHESLGSIDSLWRAQGGLAFTEVHLNQPQDAIHHYEQALATIEQLRASLNTANLEKHTGIQTRDLKTSFMQDKFFVYDELINLYHDQGDDQKAFETFERKQGRAFLEDMAKSGVQRYVGLPVEISQEEVSLENQVEAARKILEEVAGKGDDAVKQAREHLASVQAAQQDFKARLKREHPRYYALKYPQPVKLSDLQQNVLQDGELLLIYNVRKEVTDLWLVGKQHFQMFSLSVTEAQVKEKVEEFRKWGIDQADTTADDPKTASLVLKDSLKRYFADFTKASQALYQQLFPAATVRKLLGEAKPKLLYIVPTSALYELPFEALVTENTDKPHYLLQDYAISYLSSASLLKTLRDAKQRPGTAQRKPLLAFADPVYPKQNCDLKSSEDSLAVSQVKAYYASLEGGGLDGNGCPKELSSSEAKGIAESLELEEESHNPFLLTGDKASRQTVFTMNKQRQLDDFQYIVFSTHGLLPKEITPLMQPALLLSHTTPLEQEKDEDGEMVLKGFLTMSDVFRLKMNTDLVMLSACNTGRGETIKGEGTIGLTRAFMYAGTPAVSITLWSIEARAAKNLNVAWFTRLKEGQPLADSLREAKLEMLHKDGYYPYPYAWAGVVVFGDGK